MPMKEYIVVFVSGGVMQDFEIVQPTDLTRFQEIADEWGGDPDDDVYRIPVVSKDGINADWFSHVEHWEGVTPTWALDED